MNTDIELEIEAIVRAHIDIRVTAEDEGDSPVTQHIGKLTEWISDEHARRPLLSDLFSLSVTTAGGRRSFDSLVDCAHGNSSPGYRERPSRTILSVVVSPGAGAQAESLSVDPALPLLTWLVGDGSLDALLTAHLRTHAEVRRTVADESGSADLFLTVCQWLVRSAVGRPGESCRDLIESAALSALMRGVGYAVS